MTVSLFHAVFVCRRDNACIPTHVRKVEALGLPIAVRVFYWNRELDGKSACIDVKTMGIGRELQFLEMYENLPLKTLGLFNDALQRPGWTHLLKTDVNSHPIAVDMAMVAAHDMVGYVATRSSGRDNHYHRVFQKGLAERYPGPMPAVWCGGPAYVVSRALAKRVVERGVWYARGWPYEDQMVSQVACDHGMSIAPGVRYWTDGREHGN